MTIMMMMIIIKLFTSKPRRHTTEMCACIVTAFTHLHTAPLVSIECEYKL